MKTCKFQYKEPNNCIFGSVTLKNDGKISINLSNAMRYSPNMRYKAQNLANAIVAADFKHEAVVDFKEVKSYIDSKLVAELYKHTVDLKEMYIERTKEYAEKTYLWAKERSQWDIKKWYDTFDLKYTVINQSMPFESVRLISGYNKTAYSCMIDSKDKMYFIIKLGLEKFKEKEIKYAENHYQNSIEKLATRLNDKGITDESKFEISSGRIDMNFECVITHELGETKAWTIIAEGPIQRPHYRYLVK